MQICLPVCNLLHVAIILLFNGQIFCLVRLLPHLLREKVRERDLCLLLFLPEVKFEQLNNFKLNNVIK